MSRIFEIGRISVLRADKKKHIRRFRRMCIDDSAMRIKYVLSSLVCRVRADPVRPQREEHGQMP